MTTSLVATATPEVAGMIDLIVAGDYHKSGASLGLGALYDIESNLLLTETYQFEDGIYQEDDSIPNSNHYLGEAHNLYELKQQIGLHLSNYINPGYIIRVFSLDGKPLLSDVAKVNQGLADDLRLQLATTADTVVDRTLPSKLGEPFKLSDELRETVNDNEVNTFNKLKKMLQREKLRKGLIKPRHYLMNPSTDEEELIRFKSLSPQWDKLEQKWYITDVEYQRRKGGYQQWLIE